MQGTTSNIAVIGLGHLGLPLAVLLARAGHDISGVDHDSAHIARLRKGEIAWHEPGLTDMLHEAAGNFHFTTSSATPADVSIIAVPTPEDAGGGYDPAYVLQAAAALGDALARHQRPHVVIILSTVMPGALEGPVKKILQNHSGRALGPQLGLCYCPAFGAIGGLLHDYQQPDFLLIGESAAAAGDIAAGIFSSIHRNRPSLLRRALLEAELAKIALNNFLITKISFANMIGNLCATLSADADQVLSVLGHDSRISPKFLRAAMPYGGPCFTRDAAALEALGQASGVSMPFAAASIFVNNIHQSRLIQSIKSATPPGGRVAILGMAFRHGTNVTIASPAISIVQSLQSSGYDVTAWDPLLQEAPLLPLAASLAACVQGADTILIANNDPLCAQIPVFKRKCGAPVVVFDYWRVLADGSGFDIRKLG
jgi:UDPglucose 6-dehydrogenase